MMTAGPIRVLIAEDHAEYREAIALVVERAAGLELAGTAADAQEAIELAALVRPDVALVDVRMPGGGGAAAVRGIAERSPETRMIAVSATAISVEILQGGVVGRLVKNTSTADIVESVTRAARRQAPARAGTAAPAVDTSAERSRSCSAARILHAGYGERERIEALLHDRVQSRLAALRIHLGFSAEAEDGRDRPRPLDGHIDQVDTIMEELRRLAVELYPRVLTAHGLAVALRAMARESTIAVGVSPAELRRFPRAVENTIHFWCAEVIRLTALRSDERASVAIRLSDLDGRIRCSVEVDARGADLAGFPERDDLMALSDPIAAMGGTVRLALGDPRRVSLVADLPARAVA